MAGFFSGILKITGMSRDSGSFSEELPVCPSCGDEYRPEFQRCAVCDRQLVRTKCRPDDGGETKSDGARRRVEISEHDGLVTIRQGTLAEIKRLRWLLGNAGIASLPVGDGAVRGGGCCPAPSFMLQIRPDDHVAAQAVLDDDYRRSTGLDHLDPVTEVRIAGGDGQDGQPCAGCGYLLTAEQTECPDCGLSYAPR